MFGSPYALHRCLRADLARAERPQIVEELGE